MKKVFLTIVVVLMTVSCSDESSGVDESYCISETKKIRDNIAAAQSAQASGIISAQDALTSIRQSQAALDRIMKECSN